MDLYAWIGEDELGSGKVGIKRGTKANGEMVALVTLGTETLDKVSDPEYIRELQSMSNRFGKTIRLVKFRSVETVIQLTPQGART